MPGRAPRPALPAAPAESPARRARRALRIVGLLKDRYPQIRIPLAHRDPFQLLVATILSAQCTDAMVNRVTPVLFEKFKTPRDFAAATPREIERLVKPTGFFRQKTRAILGMCRSLLERFGGRVPLTMDELVTLEGVGRKTANVVLSAKRLEPWGGGDDPADGLGIVVDTHVRRLSQRLGLASTDDPEKIEQELMRIIPRPEWAGFSLRLIHFGREVCTARNPGCGDCPLRPHCPSAPYRGAPPWMRRSRPATPPGRRR
ncbi:MAG: endonuclease III [Armatimonadota bacterium]|nr:endonuclease III [Armatimonadota bacterium]MDR7450701.1 endonuclease III [Armatimonadota bacterium]MDR7466057.1 endonuclease III [Armatimonadota bacterium]MDR7493906.1 endonuclease III [Armatimonadota bacterium]MDR7504011.1 endonuclease III [Armatimonadota bacterium]